MSFKLSCWDHARYVENHSDPYEDMVREAAHKKALGIQTVIAYMHEVTKFDDYCRAFGDVGISLQSWITPETWISNPVYRQLPEEKWAEMERRFGIRLAKPCLNHPHNRESFIKNATELIALYGRRIAAVHLDAIRFENAILSGEFPCECEACRALRKRFFGHETLSPEELREPAVIYKELDIKNTSVTSIVRRLREITGSDNLQLTMAARANYLNQPDITDSPVWGLGPALIEGQDWVKWCDERLVDEIYSMNYHLNEKFFTDILNDHVRLLKDTNVVFYPGIGVLSSMGKNSPRQIEKYINKIKEAGLGGCVFFIKDDVFEVEYESVIKAAAR